MKQEIFRSRLLLWSLSAPQLMVLFLFFYLPIILAFFWAFHLEQPFGGGSTFVGLDNFRRVLGSSEFWSSASATLVYMVLASGTSVTTALILAVAADRSLRISPLARNIFIWPKAVASASIGVIFIFILNPYLGILAPLNHIWPGIWDPRNSIVDAYLMLFVANIWTAIPFSFIILLAGLQAMPPDLHKAGAIDGAGPWRRLWDIQLPLLTPQLFVVIVLEVADSLSGSFGLIDTMTSGGPGGATNLLVYKVYSDGFKAYDLSGASTQTVILMALVACITAAQYLFLERKVKYDR